MLDVQPIPKNKLQIYIWVTKQKNTSFIFHILHICMCTSFIISTKHKIIRNEYNKKFKTCLGKIFNINKIHRRANKWRGKP